MLLKVAKHAGFCLGVKNAVDIALKAAKEYKKVYILGQLIHNEKVIEKLKGLGIITVDSVEELPNDSTVIIRSHGAGKHTFNTLKLKNCTVIDATCQYVKKIHYIVKQYYENGYRIIIIGKDNHPEVLGINGWCDNSAIIIPDYNSIPALPEDKYCVVVQTTYDLLTYQQITDYIKNRHKIVAINSTICYTTKVRQSETKELAKVSDVMIVIGSKASANTLKLYNISKAECERSYLIEDKTELNSVKINNDDIVGVTAGASTPEELMTEVINTMVNEQEAKAMVQEEAAYEIQPDTATTTPISAIDASTVAEDLTNQADSDTITKENELQAEDETDKSEVDEEITQDLADRSSVSEEAPIETVATKKSTETAPKDLTMEDVMKSRFTKIREGKRVRGTIIRAAEEGLYVNLGLGKDGFIEKDEVSQDEYKPEDYKQDDDIEAIIIVGSAKEYICLSKKKADILRQEEIEIENYLKGNEFTLACDEVVKGGLVGKKGSYTVFVPASELKIGYVTDLEQYKGKPLRLRAIPERERPESDDKKRRSNNKRIVASQKIILQEEKDAREEHFWSQMIPGNIVEGKVKRYAPFGVFVQVMGFDCLVHISDVSWVKIDDPSKVLKINEAYEFEILKSDREKGRVSLSYKTLQKTPYEIAHEKYPVGTVITGVVDRLATFGAFIRIDEGVDGLVHVSQISHDWIKDASQALKVGQEVNAKVIKFEDNKITLSIKELLPEPVLEKVEVKTETTAEGKDSKRKKGRDDKSKDTPPEEFREWVGKEENVTIGDLFADLKDMVPKGKE